MPFGLTIHYSMRVSFLQPSVETVKETFTDVQDPKHHLHKSRRARGVENPNYWMELRVTSAGGNQLANFCMPKAMEEVVASEKPHIDFNTLILGKALTRVYESSCTDADATDMRCVVPLAEIWVRDIVSYRNLKLAIKGAEIEDIVIRGNNFQEIGTSATISQPKLAFCGACMKLSTRHHRCGGCKIAHYCSAECQKTDWTKLHKTECKAIQKEQKDRNEAMRAHSLEQNSRLMRLVAGC